MSAELRRTPLFEAHKKAGARIVPFAGWEMPVLYTSIKKEHHAVRNNAGLFDVSHMGELEVTGPDALVAVDRLVTNNVAGLADGQALYTVCCNAEGGILDDLIVYKMRPDKLWIVCNASNRTKIATHVKAELGGNATMTDLSDDLVMLALQGPRATDVLEDAGVPPGSLPQKPFTHTEVIVGSIACRAAATGYTGEHGYELFASAQDGLALFDQLLGAGRTHGLVPVGLGARDTLRLEARLALYGHEIDETTHPWEAGLGWVVDMDGTDFIGKTALAELKAAGLKRRLVGFEMVGRGIARHGYPIIIGDQACGTVTSGSPGPTVGKNIGLGYVPLEHSRVGTQLGVEIRNRVIDAVIVKTPFYKRPR